MKQILTKAVTNGNGEVSSMRVATLGTVILFIPTFVFCWTYISLVHQQLQEVPSGVYDLLMVLLGGKVIQKAIEVAGTAIAKKT